MTTDEFSFDQCRTECITVLQVLKRCVDQHSPRADHLLDLYSYWLEELSNAGFIESAAIAELSSDLLNCAKSTLWCKKTSSKIGFAGALQPKILTS